MLPRPLTFRQRILWALLALGVVPTATVLVSWALTIQNGSTADAMRKAVVETGTTGRALIQTLDTTRMTVRERRALDAHSVALNTVLTRAQQITAYSKYLGAAATVLLLLLGAIIVYAGTRIAGHLSRQLSRPIGELVEWTGYIGRREPLPTDPPKKGAPEFGVLRDALRGMAAELEGGRARELEAERLRAFREVARRVAHEMKNPLTPMRFALAQLARSAAPSQAEAIEVLSAESARLEQLAREFAEFGRLPEGPAAEVDLKELLEELVRTSLPPEVETILTIDPATPHVMGHLDPLRRAFSNVLRNGAEAQGGRGQLRVSVAPAAGGVEVRIADRGPGIRPSDRERIFQPYVTSKPDGTGLGLALVRQTIEAHGGTVMAEENAGGGAVFVFRIPRGKA
ncbi:MAG TPA: HAMP domain-containing sensor histidine kinase [Gemmatimonadales bacterium]|nr:HAMP domain-containing sensor histidine kinase [Gemmatimonadales bacterium]